MSFHSYASFKGNTQGTLKGESSKAGRRDKWTELVDFKMGTESPVDQNTGRLKGARTHQPITITKENGVASPQLLNAHWRSEIFDEVVIEVEGRPSSGSGEIVVQRITLTNATISRYRTYSAISGEQAERPSRFLTDYIFDYEKIDFRSY
jgi:type VI secretion system Hcp family effector